MPTNGSGDSSEDGSTESGTKRRDFMKIASVASAGALGTLAGCSGQSSDGSAQTATDSPTQDTDTSTDSDSESTQTDSGDGGEEGAAVLSYWSSIAAETPPLKEYYVNGMREFEKINDKKILVNLQALSHSNLKNKFVTAIEAGAGVPDMALSGTFGLQQFHNGNVIDHGPYIEETEGLPEDWAATQHAAGQYRDKWWAAGTTSLGSTQWGIVNEPFKQIGIENPHEELKTWTQMRRALDKIKSETSYRFPYEVTGTSGDVEAYWGNARTSFQDGVDPWLDVTDQGSYEEPYIKPNNDDRTDGMMINEIELGENYSSPGHPSRGDEDVYPMMLQGQVASQAYSAGVRALKAVNPNISFGWDGQITAIKGPKLDPNYGNEFDIPQLADKEGMHGGHTWALETQRTIQKASENKDEAWELAKFTLTDKRFLLPLLIDPKLNQSVSVYKPIQELQQQKKYADMRTQPVELSISQVANFGENFKTTGAAWDIPGTNTIRWTSLGETLSRAYADEFPTEEIGSQVYDHIKGVLQDNGLQAAN